MAKLVINISMDQGRLQVQWPQGNLIEALGMLDLARETVLQQVRAGSQSAAANPPLLIPGGPIPDQVMRQLAGKNGE